MKEIIEYPRFIKNLADGEDKFPEKAQDKVAKAITRLIANKDSKSRIVGLEGEWGAGKSNVIKMIENELKATHHVYIHDVWSFQEDLQRRTFLESLTSDLSNSEKKFLKNTTKWKGKLKELLARKKETTTDVIPVFSTGFLFVIACVVLWTIAGDFSGPIYLFTNGEIHKRFWVLCIAVIGYIGFSLKAKKILRPKDVFYLYHEKDTKKVTTENIFEEEPSPERFNKWIIELQNDFPDKIELIVVFDNMDRLPKDKVRQMWALIHTFFSEKYFEKIWVIVPYSRGQVVKAFDNDDKETDHFIDKTFTIQYQVPPPILSDWMGFFAKAYEDAFGIGDGSLGVVRSVFDRLSDKITPRKIIVFINEIVALKKMWGNEIPLKFIALFVLTKKEIINNPPFQILTKTFLKKSEPLFIDEPQLQDYIAALVYNIDPKKASQIILKEELKQTLRKGIKEKINVFAEQAYFIDLMDSLLSEELETNGFESVLNNISVDINKSLDQKRMFEIWDKLEVNHRKVQITEQQFTDIDKILLLRISNVKKQGFLNKLVADIYNVDETKFSGSSYYKIVKEIEKFVADNNLKDNNLNFSKTIKTPEIFLDYLIVAKEEYKKYKLTCNADDLNAFLVGKSLSELNDYRDIVLLAKDEDFDLNPFVDKLKENINSAEVSIENIDTLLYLLKKLEINKPIKEVLPIPKLKQLLDSSNQSFPVFADLVSMRIKQNMSINKDESQTYNIINSTEDDLLKSVANCIEDYLSIGSLIELSVIDSKPLIVNVAKYIIENKSDRVQQLDIISILQKFESVYNILKLEPQQFLNFLTEWNESARKEINKENIKTIINTQSAFLTIIQIENNLTKYLLECLINYLDDMTTENWKINLQNANSYEFILLNALLEKEKINNLPHNAFLAYAESLEDIAIGKFVIPEENGKNWQKFYLIEKNHLTPHLKNIRDKYLNGTAVISPALFTFFSPMFIELKTIEGTEGDFCRIVLHIMIDNETILNSIILTNQDYYVSIIKNAGDDATIITDKLKSLLKSKADNILLKGFCKVLGMEENTIEVVELKDENPLN